MLAHTEAFRGDIGPSSFTHLEGVAEVLGLEHGEPLYQLTCLNNTRIPQIGFPVNQVLRRG
jgi:hypothetical protein